MGNFNFNSFNPWHSWIMVCNNHVVVASCSCDWAVFPSSILPLTPSPSWFGNSGSLSKFGNDTGIDWVCFCNTLENSLNIIISSVLLASSSYTIMMLYSTDNIHHSGFCRQHSVNFSISCLLVNRSKCEQLVGAMKSMWSIAHVFFIIGAWWEVTGPEWVCVVCIWEHIIVFCGPLQVFCVLSINIHRRCRVNKLNVCQRVDVCVPVVYHVVRWAEILTSILESKIASKSDHNIICGIVGSLVGQPVVKRQGSFWSIISSQRLINNERFIITQCVKVKTVWLLIQVVISMSEDLHTVTETVKHGSPNPLHSFLRKSLLFVLVVESTKEEGIKTHFSKKTSVSIWVSKGIYLPTHCWSDPKLLHCKVMACHHVVDHVLVVRARFIMHRPSSVQKF